MSLNITIKRLLPGFESRLLLRRVVNIPRDSYDWLMGRRDPLIPSHGLWFVGGENDYQAINEEYTRHFVELGGLQPGHRVLEVGCGIGVMAARLTKFLSTEGSYDGFDIVQIGIRWASKHITPSFPNLRFIHVDVFNEHYNPGGHLAPDSLVFPYADSAFDFIFLKSVFTHMLPSAVQHYLREIRRVLKPSGCCLITAFLLDDVSTELILAGRSSIALTHDFGGCRVIDPKFPETTVGLPKQPFHQWCTDAGLELHSPIHFGSWSGRKTYLSYQDIMVLAPANGEPSRLR